MPAQYTFSKNEWPWQNFSPNELACRHCGEHFYWSEFMDALQSLRERVGRPFRLLSGHRCQLHNARIGGAIFSQHLSLAVDLNLRGHDRKEIAKSAKELGFTGRGYYRNFIHLDMGPTRHWFGNNARPLWE